MVSAVRVESRGVRTAKLQTTARWRRTAIRAGRVTAWWRAAVTVRAGMS